MKDKIIELEDGLEIYILDEFEHSSRRFVFGMEVDSETDDILENGYMLEVVSDGKDLYFEDIEEPSLIEELHIIIEERLKD